MSVSIQRSAILAFSANQMFGLINDVSTYSEFVPYCGSSEVHSCSDEIIEASLNLKKGLLEKSFTTRNFLFQEGENYRIEPSLVEGPFKEFTGLWEIESLDDKACRISLDLSFDMNPGLKNFALKNMLEMVSSQLVDAFCKRAKYLYG